MNRTHYKEIYELYQKEKVRLDNEKKKIEETGATYPPTFNVLYDGIFPLLPTVFEMFQDIFMNKFKIKDKEVITEKDLKNKIPYDNIYNPNLSDRERIFLVPERWPTRLYEYCLKDTFKNKLRKKLASKVYGIDEKDL